MDGRLRGRVALVTGAGNGIGKAIAQQMAREGASVVVNDLGTSVQGTGEDTSVADAAVSQIREAGGTAVASYDSVAEAEGCRRAVAMAVNTYGACDIVVANAGAVVGTTAPGVHVDDDSWRRLLDLYLGQKFWLTREALPAMLERRWGRVIFATSEIARGTQHSPAGAAVFSGAVGMMRDLASTHAGSGVTFNGYAPGAATRTFDHVVAHLEDGERAGPRKAELLAKYRLPGPEFVAPVVIWLCTHVASQVTGEVFGLSGGRINRWSRLKDVASLVKGDVAGSALWSLDELDELVPQHLLARP